MMVLEPQPDPAGTVRIAVQTAPNVVVVELSGRVDAAAVRQIQTRFEEATSGPLPLLVDLSGVGFMDSLGVALLVRTANRLRTAEIPMAVIPGAGPVARMLGIARVDRILNVVFSREEAWSALGAGPP
jgi:anti-sigma B factor antagonist